MPMSLTLSALWVVAATCVAMLPMRWQYAPGLLLLLLALPLLVMVAREVGWLALGAILLAVVSMYRRPLGALARYLRARIRGAA